MFGTSFSIHHQESSTVYTAIAICHTVYADCLPAKINFTLMVPFAPM